MARGRVRVYGGAVDEEMRVAVVGAWTSDALARRIKQLLAEHQVGRDDLVSVSHARSGIFGAVIANGPLSAVVVWRERLH